MKKNLDKFLWSMIMVITMTATLATGTLFSVKKESASQRQITHTVSEAPEVDLSKPRTVVRTAAIKVYYYRIFNGWLQRRLWNRTYGKWEWKSWHDVKRLK